MFFLIEKKNYMSFSGEL